MDKNEIINSSAFKVLNLMIDEKADYIVRYLSYFKDEVNRLYDPETKYKGYIRTRTYDEGDADIDLPVSLHDLKSLIDNLTDVIKGAEQIGELQRQKLRLLNDYDFTHGDDTEQKKVFG